MLMEPRAIGIKMKDGWRFLADPFRETFTEFEKDIQWFHSRDLLRMFTAILGDRAVELSQAEVAAILKERAESYREEQA